MKVLLVEDNIDLAESISEYLEMQGCSCDFAYDGESGLKISQEKSFDVYVFDISMPKMNGIELCQILRDKYKDAKPIIFLTARDALRDKLAGFSAGADDYMVKPFELKELHARLNAIVARTKAKQSVFEFDDLKIDLTQEMVTRAGVEITLSGTCYKLLKVLVLESPGLVTREALESEVWGDNLPDSDSLRSHLYKLRQLVDAKHEKKLIQTVRGRGVKISA